MKRAFGVLQVRLMGRQQRQPIPEANEYFTCVRYLRLNGIALEHWRSPCPGALRYLLQEPDLAARYAIKDPAPQEESEASNPALVQEWEDVQFDSDQEGSDDGLWD